MIIYINRTRLISSITYNPKKIYTWEQFKWEMTNESTVRIHNTNTNIIWDVLVNKYQRENVDRIIKRFLSSMVRWYGKYEKYQ